MPDPSTPQPTLEICVDTPDGLATAIAAGADRIELCAVLGVGGLTPSPGLIAAARAARVPVYVMVRPRPGDFVFGPRDLAAMLGDIAAVRAAGLAGVVLGASRPDGDLDTDLLSVLCRAAGPLGTTLHRAFDLVRDPAAALEAAVGLGFERILTSGGATDATEGRASLRTLVAGARNRIAIMPGGGITPANVRALMAETGATQVHASAKVAVPQGDAVVRWGFGPSPAHATDHATIVALRRAMEEPPR